MSDSIIQEYVVHEDGPSTFNLPQFNYNPIWTSSTTGYVIFVGSLDGTNHRIWYQKTTDSGESWGDPVEMDSGTDHNGPYGVWADIWTEGDSGTIIHVAVADDKADDLFYWNIDTSDDSVTGPVIVSTTGATLVAQEHVSVVKSRGGNLYIQSKVGSTGQVSEFHRSTDAGVNWTSRTTGDEDAQSDFFILQPGNETDNDDIWMFFYDDSATELSLKIYDNSANSWSETSISTGMDAISGSRWNQLGASPRFSDNHSIVAMWSDYDVSTADLKVWDIGGSGSITAKTDVETNVDGAIAAAVVVDQNNDDIYVVFLLSSITEVAKSVDITFKKSTDGGGTWGSRVVENDSVSSDTRFVFGGMSIDNTTFRPTWFMDAVARIVVGVDAAADSVGAVTTTSGIPTFKGLSYRIGSAAGTTSVERPRGTVVDDFLLMIVQTDNTSGTVDLPSGWTSLHTDTGSSGTGRGGNLFCYRLVESGEAASYTVTYSVSLPIDNVAIMHLTRVDATTPVHVDEFEHQQNPEIPAITTTLSNCLVLRGHAGRQGIMSTTPASHTYRYGDGSPGARIKVVSIEAAATQTFAAQDVIGGIAVDDDGFSIAIKGRGGPFVSTATVWAVQQRRVAWRS